MSDLESARDLAHATLTALERNRRRIDDLNVYPVPDGDTGTNMTLTVRAVVEHLDETTATDRAALARELTRAALMGARGNSGVIFSQILRGFAEVAGAAETIDAPSLARAFRNASDAAYRAVRKPVEGTMLTVIREMAEEAEARANANPIDLLHAVVERGADAVERTPQYLEVLRDASGLELRDGADVHLGGGDRQPQAQVAQDLHAFGDPRVEQVRGPGDDVRPPQAPVLPDHLLHLG